MAKYVPTRTPIYLSRLGQIPLAKQGYDTYNTDNYFKAYGQSKFIVRFSDKKRRTVYAKDLQKAKEKACEETGNAMSDIVEVYMTTPKK